MLSKELILTMLITGGLTEPSGNFKLCPGEQREYRNLFIYTTYDNFGTPFVNHCSKNISEFGLISYLMEYRNKFKKDLVPVLNKLIEKFPRYSKDFERIKNKVKYQVFVDKITR